MRRTHYLAAAVATRLADGLAALATGVAATAVRTAAVAVAAASLSFKFHIYSSLLYTHKKISIEVLKN